MSAIGHRPVKRRKLGHPGALAAVTLCLLAAPTVSDAAVLDANCPGPAGSSFASSGNQRFAQGFAALTTGSLVRAQAAINKALMPGGDWVMQIVDTDATGLPVNSALASTTIPDATVPDGDSTITGTFAPGAAVVAGHRYALVVTRPGASKLSWNQRSGNPCPGQEFLSMSQTGSWAANNPGFDFVFSVFVEPPNDFSIGKLKGRHLSLTVPGAGAVNVRDASGAAGAQARAAASKKLLKPSTATAGGAGTLNVTLRLTKRAKDRLAAKHKLKVNAAITFTPTGGTAKTKTAKLKLRQK